MTLPVYIDTKSIIYEKICNNPGIHFRELVNSLGREVGVIEYHIRRLEKEDLIIGIRHRKQKMFFDSTWEERIDDVKILINNLRKTIPRSILIYLSNLKVEYISLKSLADELGISSSGLHWHIKRLIEDKLILPKRRGREVLLRLNIESMLIHKLGKEIYPSKWEIFLDEIHYKLT